MNDGLGYVGHADLGLESRVALLADLGIPAVATDLKGSVCHWNQPAAQLYGREQHEMLGLALSTVRLSQTDDAIAGSVVRELLEVGRWHGEIEIEDAAGASLRLDVRASVVVDSDDTPVGFEAAITDLSERVEAERQAAESESRLRLACRVAGLGSWEWDPREDRLTADRLMSLLGRDPGTVVTMAEALAALPAVDRTRVRSALQTMQSTGVDSFSVEYRVDGRDGATRYLEAHCVARRDPAGNLTRVTGITQDVTARVRAGDQLRETGTFWQATLDSLAAHIAILDEYGEIIAVNAAWRRFALAEGAGSDYIGSNYIAVCDAAEEPLATVVASGLREMLAGERDRLELDYPCHSPSERRWFLLRATRLAGAGLVRVVVMHADMTKRHQAQERAFVQAALLDEIDVSVILTDLDLTVLSWNAGAERLYGWTAEEAVGRSASETILPAESFLSAEEGGRDLTRQSDGRWDGEYTVRRKDGSTFPAHVRSRLISDQDGHVSGAANVAMDITEQKESERALVSARNYLRAVTDSMGEGVFTIDTDGRGTYINQVAQDLLGWSGEDLRGREVHPILHSQRADGSPLPIEECSMLRARQDGVVVRVADDIFTRKDGSRLPVAYTASPFATDDGIEGCVVVFEDITERKLAAQLVERDLDKLAWMERIQEALTEERFVLYGQPIVDLRTGDVVQHELLIRMRGGLDSDAATEPIPPVSFLPVAEEFGLITEIDRWAIDRSIEIAATGQNVEVNVSGRSISAPGLIDHIESAIIRTGADPAGIVFEITETSLVSDEPAARAFVTGLHALGCKIALDDFGTGYGGFTYLKQLPVDFLKIDIEFVRDVLTNSASHNVVEAIVSLAASFGLKTVGEGIEDEETLVLLRDLGVDYGQGFYIGRPAQLEVVDGRPTTEGDRS
jgi:PAS domain S-box-containing protein